MAASPTHAAEEASDSPPSMRAQTGHLVTCDWRWRLSSDTAPPGLLRELEPHVRRHRFRYSFGFRLAMCRGAAEIQRRHGARGLILIERKILPDPPPPFRQSFEAIELGTSDPQLKTLTSEAPTRQEKGRMVGLWIGAFAATAVLFLVSGLLWYRPGVMARAGAPLALVIGGNAVLVAAILMIIHYAKSRRRWFLVPGGVVLRVLHRGRPAELRLRTPDECVAFLDLVRTKNGSYRNIALWSQTGAESSMCTEREQRAFIAAWLSPVPPPPLSQLEAMLA